MRKAKPTIPKFAKRHYEALALVIQGLALSHNELGDDEMDGLVCVRQGIAGDFVNMLGKDNPRFDRERFIVARVAGANVRARKANGQIMPSIEMGGKIMAPEPFKPISQSAVHVLALMAARKVVREQMRDEGRRISLVPPAEIAGKARAYLAEHRGELYGEAIATAWTIAAKDQRGGLNKWLFDHRRSKRADRPVLVTPDRT